MTSKPGLKARSKSIKAAMAAAGAKPAGPSGAATGDAAPAVAAAALVPTDPSIRRILEERAEIYARPPKAKRGPHGGDFFVQVGFGGPDRYGIPFDVADEIIAAADVTPVPGTPAHIAGVINLRGTLLSVVDLRPLIGLETPSLSVDHILVVAGRDVRFGILIDAVDGSVSYRAEDLAPPLGGKARIEGAFVAGIHDGRVAVLDMDAVMRAPSLIVDQR